MKKKEKIEIFIATHKKFCFPTSDIYVPLHVGAKDKKDLGYLKDSIGDNISKKNPNYCELTCIYWIWKNVKSDIVGLVHYRRYFYNKCLVFDKKNILNNEEIISILEKNDIIVAQRGYTWKGTVKLQYERMHLKNDLDECKKIIEKKYPDYIESFNVVFDGKHYSPFNMLITKKEIYDSYCEWLFSIFDELEQKITIDDGRSKYNSRVYGFLSERLLNVWILKNSNYKIVEKPVFNIEENMLKQNIQSLIKRVIKK